MSSLRVSETETVGYGVRGDVVHDICATDHICFIDLAFVLCGEGDRRAIGVFDQQSHAAGFAGQRSRGECVGKFAPVAYTAPFMLRPLFMVHLAICSLVS